MADITARLIWYRLGELSDHLRTYILDEDVDVLDILFAVWVVVAVVILFLVYGLEWLSHQSTKPSTAVDDAERWRRLKRQHSFFTMEPSRPESELRAAMEENAVVNAIQVDSGRDKETGGLPNVNCQWMNRVILWMYLNYSGSPQWVGQWLESMNGELERTTREDEVRLEFVDIAAGSLPPKILSWMVEPDEDTRSLFLRAKVSISEIGFVVRLVKRRQETIQRLCHVLLRNFVGEVRIACEMGANVEGVRMLVKFTEKPKMEVSASLPECKPSIAQKLPIDFDIVKSKVVDALTTSRTEVTFHAPQLLNRGDSRGVDAVLAEAVASGDVRVRARPQVTLSSTPEVIGNGDGGMEEEVIVEKRTRREASEKEKTENSTIPRFYSGQRSYNSSSSRNSNGSINRPLKFAQNETAPPTQTSPQTPTPIRTPVSELTKGQSLLAKVIKVSGLAAGHRNKERDFWCTVEMDEPFQRHSTHPVRGCNSVFWDQSFVLELNGNTQRVSFVVLDGGQQRGVVGRTVVPIRDLMAHPSSRQIIPLDMEVPTRRRTREAAASSQASITVEFLFLRPEQSPAPIRPTTARLANSAPRQSQREAPPSSSSSSASSTASSTASSASSAHNPPALVQSRPEKVNSVPIVITDDNSEAVVNSRILADFMSPPNTIETLTSTNSSSVSAAGHVIESSQVVGGRQDFQMRLQRPSQSSNSKETPPASDSLRDPMVSQDADIKKTQERSRSEKPKQAEAKRSRSFGSRLRKSLGSGLRSKERSQSADRLSNSLHPPAAPPKATGTSPVGSQTSLQKSKTSGLSGSFRKLFGGKKSKGNVTSSDRQPQLSGGGLMVSRSSPHLGPDRPTISGSSYDRSPRIRPRPQQQLTLRAPNYPNSESSYSSEGYMITRDFTERRDSYV